MLQLAFPYEFPSCRNSPGRLRPAPTQRQAHPQAGSQPRDRFGSGGPWEDGRNQQPTCLNWSQEARGWSEPGLARPPQLAQFPCLPWGSECLCVGWQSA